MDRLDLDMGRYAVFVWPAFAISAVVLLAMIGDTLTRAGRWRRRVEQLEREEG